MASSLDYSTNNGKVRLLISDIDEANPIFAYADSGDDPIDAFLALHDQNVKRSAAAALMAIAVNEVLVQKRIKSLDLSTDGPAEAKELLALAKQYRDEAEFEDVDGAFDWAEMVNNDAQWKERITKQRLTGL